MPVCVPKPLVGGFGCDELVLYGISLLAMQILDMEVDQTAVRSSKQAEREKEAKMRNKTARAAMRAKSREEPPVQDTTETQPEKEQTK